MDSCRNRNVNVTGGVHGGDQGEPSVFFSALILGRGTPMRVGQGFFGTNLT